jgi:hypothetical protein
MGVFLSRVSLFAYITIIATRAAFLKLHFSFLENMKEYHEEE